MDNNITVRFFRIDPIHQSAPPFQDALAAAYERGEAPKDREEDLGSGVVVRLERMSISGSFIDGEIVRRQMTNLPPEVNDSGLSVLPLSDGNGLGHCVAFRYSVGLRVLAIQFDVRAVSLGRFLRYIRLTDGTADFHATPLVTQDAWDRYNRGLPRTLEMTIANPASLPAIEGEVISAIESSRRMSEAYHAPVIKVSISMGHHKGFLDRSAVGRFLRFFTSGEGRDADIRRLRTKVKSSSGGEQEEINFLDEELFVKEKIELAEKDPDAHYNQRISFIASCLDEKIGYIRDVYGEAS